MSRWAAVLCAIIILIGPVFLSACDVPFSAPPLPVVNTPIESSPPTVENDIPSTGSIEVFFTGKESQSLELENALVTAVYGADQSVDMAIYNFNLDTVGEALLDAHTRGVRVRIVTESDSLDGRWFDQFQKAGIEVFGDGREELMHNKFLVIDQREVWTGSLNLTKTGLYEDDNNFARFVSAGLAKHYSAVFEAMFTDGKFGTQRDASDLDPALDVVGVPVEVYFSPEDRPEKRLVKLVRDAQKSVLVLAYSFTSDPLSDALLDRADAGVAVRGVFDTSQADGKGADYGHLRQAGLDVRLDGNTGLMHNKVLIIDDQIVVLGSYNFTRAANQANDENLVVVFDPYIARQYRESFDRIYQAGQ
jgi:phosphatidylserine/phosphatidylglycerophosphate/cardiolipin synthase-like enzyme